MITWFVRVPTQKRVVSKAGTLLVHVVHLRYVVYSCVEELHLLHYSCILVCFMFLFSCFCTFLMLISQLDLSLRILLEFTKAVSF